MNEMRWRRLDRLQPRKYIEESDRVVYAREYKAKGGYDASATNQSVINFKKPMARKHLPEWCYKGQAVEQFVQDLLAFTSRIQLPQFTFVATPPSACEGDPAYDDRVSRVLQTLRSRDSRLIIEALFRHKASKKPSHLGGSRDVDEIFENLEWIGFQDVPPSMVFLLDDVLSTGAHFAACKRLIAQHAPGVEVVGVFWAICV